MLACNLYAISTCPRASKVVPCSAKVLTPIRLAARSPITQHSVAPFSVPPIITRNLSLPLLEQTPCRKNSFINNQFTNNDRLGLRYYSHHKNKDNGYTNQGKDQILKDALPPNIPFPQEPQTLLTADDWHHFFQNYTNQSMHLNPIRVQIQNQFTDEIDQLRQVCFPGVKPVNSARDLFDDRSKHIVIMIDNVLAAYGRLTPGPNAVFENWTRREAKIPVGKNIIDLGRGLVNPQFRGLGLLELVFILALFYAKKSNFKFMVGSVTLSGTIGAKASRYGFINSGQPVHMYGEECNSVTHFSQPIVCDLEKSHNLWGNMIEKQLAFLASKGYRL